VKFSQFIFRDYRYDAAASTLSLQYRFKEGPCFEEKLVFDFAHRSLSRADVEVLDRIFRLIFLLSGISYYKAFLPKILVCEAFALDRNITEFLHKFYEEGLAEFAFRNGISLHNHFQFQASLRPSDPPIALDLPRKTCVPVGGGKDSLVTVECLRHSGEQLVLFSLGDAQPITSCIAATQLPFIRVYRRLDATLFELNEAGALNGHVPITGILSAIVLACAVMSGFDVIAMSNEHSASAPNFRVGGVEVNHQYSKSLEFERDFSNYVLEAISPSITYFSLLRPLSEVEIARRFARYRQYLPIFRSCNTAFKQSPAARGQRWCCNCPKCRFVFLALAPFVAKPELTGIFGRNLLDDPAQQDGFAELCGLQKHKPFECVGETSESAAVMRHLAHHTEWRGDDVVRRLNADFAALLQTGGKEYRALFEMKTPHQVPADYLAMLDACG